MKNIFKNFLKLTFICLFFVISGCEKDLYEDQIKSTHSNKRYITIDELKNFPAAFKLYQNIDTQNSSTRDLVATESRIIYNAALDFYINTDKILYIENEGLQTFTFEVYRNDNDLTKVENLVLSFKSDTDFESYLTKYEFTEEEKDLINEGLTVPNITSKTTLTTLSGNVIVAMNDYSGTIYHDNQGNCYMVDHIEPVGINEVIIYYISVNCPPTIANVDEDGNTGGGFDNTINGFGTYDNTGIINWIVGTGVWIGGGSITEGDGNYNPDENGNIDEIVFLDTSPVLTSQLNSGKAYLTTQKIGTIINLSNNQFNYLINNYEISRIFLNLLENDDSEANKTFVSEIIDLALLEPNPVEAQKLINLTVLLENSGDQLFTDEFELSLDPYVDIDIHGPISTLDHHFVAINIWLKYNKLRQINPEWSRRKCLWYASKEVIHLSLDVFGIIPVFGEPADFINGVLYTIEGEALQATLSFAATVPIVGWAATGVKFAIKVVPTATGTTKLIWKVAANGVLQFGNRGQLRKVLNLVVGDGLQAHHIIPWNKQSKSIVQRAAKSENAFHMNEALNGIPLSTAVHNGSHAHYDNLIQERFDLFNETFPNATPDQCYDFVVDLIQDIRTAIQNNPTTPINELIF
ncbi:AHH domain-containing protein [Flavobacterium terrisoli]|uniref:AHH domain-containing protein n=1 Tax=Flavobacterium terrisoli TaxID=3242195 RepID=UPI002543C930|nr:AHH domain-containing protein [Flavobacterium buctense]